MIRVTRKASDAPQDLVGEDSPGKKERRDAERLFEKLEADPKKDVSDFSFTFKAYKRAAVTEALNEMFRGKCAYCETRYSSSQPMDVEHWRPKGLAERDGLPAMKPGYYWLAADWDNLLPSCIDCNRARTQIVPPQNKKVKLGKANQFPLADEAKRVFSHRDASRIDDEGPLILNPCVDDPEEHLEFTSDAGVRPRTGASEIHRKKAERSIDVYALNRSGLVISRKEVLHLIVQRKFAIRKLMEIHDALQDLPQGNQASRRRKEALELLVEELMLHEIKALNWFMEPERTYSLLARQFVTEFLEDIRGDLPIPL